MGGRLDDPPSDVFHPVLDERDGGVICFLAEGDREQRLHMDSEGLRHVSGPPVAEDGSKLPAVRAAETASSRRTVFGFHVPNVLDSFAASHRYRSYIGDIAMPRARAPQTPKEKRQRLLAQAAKKRAAKARERRAKASGDRLERDDTVRAKKIARAGIPPALWDAFLAALKRRKETV